MGGGAGSRELPGLLPSVWAGQSPVGAVDSRISAICYFCCVPESAIEVQSETLERSKNWLFGAKRGGGGLKTVVLNGLSGNWFA